MIERGDRMKLFHLSDLHLGKRLNEYSLIDDQRHILNQTLTMMDDESPDALMICGDVYDKAMPSAEAVSLFDDFLWEVSKRRIPTLIISGNHDSPERLSFGSRIMERSQVYLSRSYEPNGTPVTLDDEFGPVNFFLLPFVKPINVQRALMEEFPEEADAIRTYTDALRAAIGHMNVDTTERNVLLAHQFVVGGVTSESENRNVGGLDQVDADVFDPFDYVALGHLHGPQRIARDTLRYSGTPLKYSLSEEHHHKSVTVVELGAKGEVDLRFLPLVPLRDLRSIRGTYDEVTLKDNYHNTNTEDYVHVTLTDEDDIPNAIDRLRSVYPNILGLRYDNLRMSQSARVEVEEQVEQLTPTELFAQFFELQNNQPLSDAQRALVKTIIEHVWEEES